MPQLHALIFDVDGTIAETEQNGHRVAFNRAFAQAGLDWHWSSELYSQLLSVSGGKERIRFYISQYCPNSEELKSAVDLTDFIATLHTVKTDYFKQLLQDGQIPPRPGIVRLIQEARAMGIRLAIATTSAPENAIALLTTVLAPDSPGWFEVIAAGDIVPRKKPAPDIYHYVVQSMALNPADCLVIEDSQHGLEAATQAGLNTVVTVNRYTRDQQFPDALLVLDHLGEPDLPFRVINGDIGNATYFDISLAESLMNGH
ncbi:MAG: HAD family hydrolase [Elainellaceae cyanobacterium]